MRVIGRKPVLELLQSGKPVQRIRLSLGTQGRIIGDIVREAKKRKVRIDRVPQDVVKHTFGSGNHQGVIAETADLATRSLKEIGTTIKIRGGLIVALDGVTDPHHLGAIARSALAANADCLLMSSRRSAPLSETAIKSSAGTLNRFPIVTVSNLADALQQLQKDDWWVYGAAGDKGSRDLWAHEWDERVVVVVGSEGDGLAHRTREICDALVRIPMNERVESLSVSAAASVVLFDVARKREKA